MAHKDIFSIIKSYDEPQQVMRLGMYPYFRTIEGTSGNQVWCEGRRKIMVGSNNYLGLATDERVIEAASDALRKYGAGCTGSRFLNGTIKLHADLEEKLATFLGREAVILFSTGFFANQGALISLVQAGDSILCDRENHASIIDGCNASPAKTIPFSHNSAESLERRLSRIPEESGKLLVVDGVFSMSGDLVNLPSLARVAKKYGTRIYVDEAHSLGVYGKKGEGVVGHFGMEKDVDFVMGTFSKSLGTMGGFIAADAFVVNYLRHKARCFMFTASLAPAVAGAALKALEILQEEPERREALWKNSKKMHDGFRSIGFNIGTTQSPIVPLLIGSETKAFVFSQKLYEAGIFTTPAAYPAVRYGEAIVRTSFMATHTEEELNYVLETCERIGKELEIFKDAAYTGEKQRRNSGYDWTVYQEKRPETFRTPPREDSETGAVLRPAVSGQYHQNI